MSREDLTVHRRKVATEQEAIAVGFTGSPTILITDKVRSRPVMSKWGWRCRVYWTPHGLAGSPSVAQLVDALS